ncbi:lipocalin family protein, partial [Leclercia adecarboxylata]|uniref:lipocalin family protein n=1 Tax=Leclercia adecarboxylata TaxID=83655 RepID=UPI00234DD274
MAPLPSIAPPTRPEHDASTTQRSRRRTRPGFTRPWQQARHRGIAFPPAVAHDTHPDLKTVPDLKLPRYLGTWYEIARLPMKHEPEG